MTIEHCITMTNKKSQQKNGQLMFVTTKMEKSNLQKQIILI